VLPEPEVAPAVEVLLGEEEAEDMVALVVAGWSRGTELERGVAWDAEERRCGDWEEDSLLVR
jgi:hypothetical protein